MAGESLGNQRELGWLYRPSFPDTWEKANLYSLATWINGMAFRNFNFSPTGRPVIKIAEIKNGITGQTRFSDADYDGRYFVVEGDMLFSWSGQPETSIDVFWWHGPEGWLNQHIFKVIPHEDHCLPVFLYYLLKYLEPNFVAIARNKQTTGLGHVTKTDMENIEVGIPRWPVQEAIAHILGTMDDRIELNRRMNENLEAIARVIFKSWFVDFDPVKAKVDGRQPVGMDAETAALFPDSFEDSPLGKIPRGWTIIDLGEVMSICDSKRVPLSNREREKRRGPYPYYGAASVMDYIDDYLFDGRYVLVGEDGSVIDYDDHPVLQYVWGKFWANNHAHVLQGTNGISTEFLLQFLKTLNIGPYITGAVQPKLNQGNLKSIPFIMPPKTVCSTFDQTIGSLFSRIRSATDETRTLATTRDTLLPRLVSGEIRVKDVEKFVEKHAG